MTHKSYFIGLKIVFGKKIGAIYERIMWVRFNPLKLRLNQTSGNLENSGKLKNFSLGGGDFLMAIFDQLSCGWSF